MTPTPKTLEYSSIKRSRKRVAMIIVLVLSAISVALAGRSWVRRLQTMNDAYRDSRALQNLVDLDLVSLRSGLIPIDSEARAVRLPLYTMSWSFGGNPIQSRTLDNWLEFSNQPRSSSFYRATVCVAKLESASGSRYVGVDVILSDDFQPRAVTGTIRVIKPATFLSMPKLVHEQTRPVVTFKDRLTIPPGTNDPNHPDRATFKVIADGVEKTFVVILRKDDTVAFEEQPSN